MVSVIIRTHGDRAINLLKESIDSIKKQTYKNIEIIVIEDGTSNAAKHLDKNIIYKSIAKSGRCVAGNTGLELANGDYIMFLDDDDQIYPDHISLLANELDNNQEIDAAYSAALEIPTQLVSLNPLHYKEGKSQKTYAVPFSHALMWHSNFIPIQSILFRRKLYELYGGFDKNMDQFEDWDLWLRYSFNHNFKFINKVTSFLRVPLKKEEAESRLKEMNKSYTSICEKLKKMNIETNAFEIQKLCDEYCEAIEYTKKPKSFIKELWYSCNIGKQLKTFERQLRHKIKK